MAHQAHNIPWTVLARNLKWSPSSNCDGRATNLHFRCKPHQGRELTYFVEAVLKNIDEHSKTERKKCAETYNAPAPDDIVLSDDVVRRISPTVWRLRQRCDSCAGLEVEATYNPKLCQHREGPRCKCPVPYQERKMASFLRKHVYRGCYQFWNNNKEAFLTAELTKTLLLYGEMDTLLLICAHPEIGLESWWNAFQCQCVVSVLSHALCSISC